MPVQRFRSVGDMPRPERSGEQDLVPRIRAVWNRAFLLCPPSFERGVKRFRSIEGANDDRLRTTIERMRQRASAVAPK